MFIDHFHALEDGRVSITPAQASRFAKAIAGDFNPLHDAGATRFCVPGDLLFALVLRHCGVSPRMAFNFTGMVGAGVTLLLPNVDGKVLTLSDDDGKQYLAVEREGAPAHTPALVENLVRGYVAFSGHNFPHILVPLMAEHGVMINPERPLVVYESMSFELQRLDMQELELRLTDSRLAVNGRRGEAELFFGIYSNGCEVGSGRKRLVLSGLRPYDAAGLQGLIDRYTGWREAFVSA